MKNLLLSLVLLAALLNSGCAALIVNRLHGKIPLADAESLKVTVNVAGVGGGAIDVEGVKVSSSGALTAAKYHESITTGGGSVTVDGVNVKLRKP